MKFLKVKIKSEHRIKCFMPANGETAVIPSSNNTLPATVSVSLLKAASAPARAAGARGQAGLTTVWAPTSSRPSRRCSPHTSKCNC